MSLQLSRLKELLSYNPDTGNFTWLVSRGKAKKNDIAGHLEHTGYISIRIHGKAYLAHRLAWFYVFGGFPDSDLDHVNGVRTDNSMNNLRIATKPQNM